jgi:hypothetical protein
MPRNRHLLRNRVFFGKGDKRPVEYRKKPQTGAKLIKQLNNRAAYEAKIAASQWKLSKRKLPLQDTVEGCPLPHLRASKSNYQHLIYVIILHCFSVPLASEEKARHHGDSAMPTNGTIIVPMTPEKSALPCPDEVPATPSPFNSPMFVAKRPSLITCPSFILAPDTPQAVLENLNSKIPDSTGPPRIAGRRVRPLIFSTLSSRGNSGSIPPSSLSRLARVTAFAPSPTVLSIPGVIIRPRQDEQLPPEIDQSALEEVSRQQLERQRNLDLESLRAWASTL